MSPTQRTIKYMAMGLGLLLALGIISGILSAVVGVAGFFSGAQGSEQQVTTQIVRDFEDITSLDVSHAAGKLEIKNGEAFRVEAFNVDEGRFTCQRRDDGTLYFQDESIYHAFNIFNWNFGGNATPSIVITLPADTRLAYASIHLGAGETQVEQLICDELKLECGAGSFRADRMAADKVDISGGVGEIRIENMDFKDMTAKTGVGEVRLSGRLTGDNRVECGVGELRLNLADARSAYAISAKSGLGDIRIDGEKISGELGDSADAPNRLRLQGGVGAIRVQFGQAADWQAN